ncbi:MAG: glycerol-3-phosphate 1-O-acyltransferase PlsY [Ruminococcaceae bacterium]|nr:glycerol-3-phosphate 1-O-acyltransferase PlsY [Oscillospiraceae bacterium]
MIVRDILSMVGDPILASALIVLGAAALCYIPGGVNGAIVASHVFYGEDIRNFGSGNAGLTNFYRIYGARYVWCVILVDMGKALVAVLLGTWIFGPEGAVFGKYFAGFFCIVGHMFPFFYRFKGGKGILCSGMTLILLDWRIALVGWGVFALLWLATKYVSLGSICAAVSLPVMTWAVYHSESDFPTIFTLSLLMAALVLWAHRENIKRLLTGTENKFQWHKGEPKKSKT